METQQAQAPGAPPVPMEIEWCELSLKCDATLTVGTYGGEPTEWMKPGAEFKVHMRGVPDPAQTQAAYVYAYEQLGTALAQVIDHLQKRMVEARRGG